MNREIRFRGKSIEDGKWVYGCLVNNMWTYSELSKFKKGTSVCEIITGEYESDCWDEAINEDSNIVTVHPKSVGQFTGLHDKNGEDIFEKDVVYLPNNGICIVEFPFIELYEAHSKGGIMGILGNIFESPELIEK